MINLCFHFYSSGQKPGQRQSQKLLSGKFEKHFLNISFSQPIKNSFHSTFGDPLDAVLLFGSSLLQWE